MTGLLAEGRAATAPLDRSTPQQAHADAGLPSPRRAFAIAAVLSAMSLVVLDAGMANVALPTMARALNATPSLAVLVITAYQTALVMALLPCAALGERLGYWRVFVWGVALFTAASALCALSPSLPWLVAARFVQGLGGAAVMALGVALLRLSVPPEQLGAAIGWNALTVALSSAASPAIGALILAGMGWPWLFLVNLPVGATALLAARALPRVAGTAQRIDGRSVALNGVVFALLVIGAELLPARPLAAGLLLAIAAIALVGLVRREMPKAAPMIPLDLLRGRSFRVSVIASVCCFTGQTAGLVALPFYLQHQLGQTPLEAGIYMTPWPLTVAATAVVAGRLADRIPTAWLCAVGGACLALGLAATALWPLQGDPRPLIAFAIVCGLGFGLFQVPNNRNMFLSAPPERSGAAGGTQSTARLTGQTAGAVLMTLLFTTTSLDLAPRVGLGIGAVLALTAGIVSATRGPARGASARAAPDVRRSRSDGSLQAGLSR
ncbi:MAG TPA: MFS transporter [Sorangium sp.]|nr:MFS transporter [Sorangium sp.]